MAALRGTLTAEHANGGTPSEVSRLSAFRLRANLGTWHTKVYVCLDRDGTVLLTVERDGVRLHDWKHDTPEA